MRQALTAGRGQSTVANHWVYCRMLVYRINMSYTALCEYIVHLASPYIHTLAIIKRSLFTQDWVRLFMVAFKPSIGGLSGKNSAEI